MRILIADDDSTSQKVLVGMLRKWGHELEVTGDGYEAWDVLKCDDAPRFCIFDWMMPGLDGVQLCRRIRAREKEYYTYIILLTSRAQKEDVSVGFEAGVDDYLLKPVDGFELEHRVKAGARLIRYEEDLAQSRAELTRYAREMESLAGERARQLTHADRLATLGTLSAGIAHEVNNPATFISGNAQTMQKAWKVVQQRLEMVHSASEKVDPQIAFLLEEFPKMLDGVRKGVERITKITSGLKAYSRGNKGEKKPFDLHASIQEAMVLCHNALKYHVTVELELADEKLMVVGDEQQIDQVFVNLLVNAADATKIRGKCALRIAASREDEMARIIIEDDGPGFSAGVLDQLFTPFFTTKKQGEGTGLGLSITQGIIEEHGGSISAENRAGRGARFVIRLPLDASISAVNDTESVSNAEEKGR